MTTVKKRPVTFKELQAYGIPYCRHHLQDLEEDGSLPLRIDLGRCREFGS